MTAPSLDERIRRYERKLKADGLGEETINHYVNAIRRGLAGRSLRGLVQRATTRSTQRLVAAAVSRWAAQEKDRGLAKWVHNRAALDAAGPRKVKLTSAGRKKFLAAVAALPDPRRSVIQIVVWSGLRLGQVLGLRRKALAAALPDQPNLRPELQAPASYLGSLSWPYLDRLISPSGYVAAYAVIRRTIAAACREAGLPYIQPEEFRRLIRAEALRAARRAAHAAKARAATVVAQATAAEPAEPAVAAAVGRSTSS